MPLYSDEGNVLDLAVGKLPDAPKPAEDPGHFDILRAAFRTENLIGSVFSRTRDDAEGYDPTYNPWNDIKGTQYEQHWKSFASSMSKRQTLNMMGQIDQETHDRGVLQASGWEGALASFGASVLDPTLFIPVAGQVSKIKGGYSLLKNALIIGANAGLSTTVQETGLLSTQELRTPQESITAVGGTIILGGLLGAGATVFSKADTEKALKGYDYLLTGDNSGLSAAKKMEPTLDELTPVGKTAGALAKITQKVSPNLRLQFSPSPAARKISQQLAEGALMQKLNTEGSSLGAAVETMVRVEVDGHFAPAVESVQTIFRDMKKSGLNMSFHDFDQAVGQAMRNGDEGINPFVSKAAKAWRDTLVSPVFERLKEAGLLKKGDDVAFSKSYFPRMYNREVMIANSEKIKAEWADTLHTHIKEQFAKDLERHTNRLDSFKQQIADISASGNTRAEELDKLAAQLDAYDTGQNAQALSEISRLRSQQPDGYKEKIKDIKAKGGDELNKFIKEKKALRRRQKSLNSGIEGMEEKRQKIVSQLYDLDATNQRALQRLVKKGQDLQKLADKLDPEELAAKLSDLRTDFHTALLKSTSALEKHVASKEAIKQETGARILAALEQEGLDRWLLDNSGLVKEYDIKYTRSTAEGTPEEIKGKRAEASALSSVQRKRAAEIAKAETSQAVKLQAETDTFMKAEQARIERLNRIDARVQSAEEFDIDEQLAIAKDATDQLVADISERSLVRGERQAALVQRLNAVDPKFVAKALESLESKVKKLESKFSQKWETQRFGDLSKADFTNMAKQIAEDAFDRITGQVYGDASAVEPDFRIPVQRGPVRERTLPIPDEVLQRQGILYNNAQDVLHYYARVGMADSHLTNVFGSPSMVEPLEEIKASYAKLKKEAGGPAPKEGASEKQTAAYEKAKSTELVRLDAREKADIKDLRALRDLIRGTYKAAENVSSLGRISRGLAHFNYIRNLGGVVISSLSDIYRPAMVHGLGPYLSKGIGPLLSNSKAIKLTKAEAKYAGVAEKILNGRVASLAEIGDSAARGSAIERFMENTTRVASQWNGMTIWNDFHKSLEARIVEDKLLGADIPKAERAYLGVDNDMHQRILEQFAAHGETEDGIRIANTQDWTNPQAVLAFRSAINKQVNATIVTPGVGDAPLISKTPLGRLLLQFRSFMFSAHQKVLLRGLQDSKARFASAMVAMTTIGMLVGYLRAWRGGQERFDKFLNEAQNPGFLISEGLDNSGIFTLGFDIANTTERLTPSAGVKFNPIKTPSSYLGTFVNPSAPAQGTSTRFAMQSPVETIMGPSAGLLGDVFQASGAGVNAAQGEEITRAQEKAALSLVPFNTYYGFREATNMLLPDEE